MSTTTNNIIAQETTLVPTNNTIASAAQNVTSLSPIDDSRPAIETSFVAEKEQTSAAASASEQKKEEKPKKRRKVEHCKLVHEDDCIIITKDFAKRANNPSSPEFKKLAMLRREFPTYSVVARTAEKSPTRPSMKGLTQEFMEKHIQTLYPNDVVEYNKQKKIAEALKSPHMYMRNWFNKTYPDWRENTVRKSA